MLNNISNLISPELFKILMEMGHDDELVIADGNFPSYSMANKIINYYGVSIRTILDEILKYFPLDDFVDYNAIIMRTPKNNSGIPEIWDEYKKVFQKHKYDTEIKLLNRKDFYLRSQNAYAIIATSDMTPYGNMLIKKGVVKPVQKEKIIK